MHRFVIRWFVGTLFFWAASELQAEEAKPPSGTLPLPADHAAKMAKGLEIFKGSVRDILLKNCAECHSGEKVEGEFDISDRVALLKGGPRGPAVLPGNAKE